MNDLIDRRQAIKAIDDLPNCYNGFSDTYDKAYIIGVLEELPPAAPRWVRCEEQLPPNDGKEVLVTDGFHVGIGVCAYKWSKTRKWTQEAVWYKWNLNDYGYPMRRFKPDTHIKAWMPLPEPPKEDA